MLAVIFGMKNAVLNEEREQYLKQVFWAILEAMKNDQLKDLLEGFYFPFKQDNFEQWLISNHERLQWFFNRDGSQLVSTLMVDDKSAAALKLNRDGSIESAAPDDTFANRSLAFLSLLLKEELPYPWSDSIDQSAYAQVLRSFAGMEALSFKGAIVDLDGNDSRQISRLFAMEGFRPQEPFYPEEYYTLNRFLDQGKSPYPVHILGRETQENLFKIYDKALWQTSQRRRGALDAAYLSFSNNTALSLMDAYFHPYSALLEPEFFEGIDRVPSDLDLDLFYFTGVYSGHPETNYVKNVLSRTLDADGQIWFCRDLYKEANQELVEVKGFGDGGKSSWKLVQEDGKLKVVCDSNESYDGSILLGSSRYYNTSSKTLFHATQKDEMSFWKTRGLRPSGMSYEVPEDYDLDDLLFYIDEFNRKYHQDLEIDVKTARTEDLGIEVDLVDKELGLVRFSLLHKGERVSLPKFAVDPIFNALTGGLGSFFYEDNRNLAPKAQGAKRQNTLKLLRHAGFFHLLFHESLKLRGQEDSPQAFIERIKELALAAVLKQVHVQPSLSEQWKREFGPKAVSILKDFLSQFNSDRGYDFSFQTSDGIYDCKVNDALSLLLPYLSEFLINSLGEDVLAKTRFKELKPGEEVASLQLKGAIAGILLSDVPDNFRILIEGKPMEELNEKDIDSVFKVEASQEAINWFELHPEVFFKGKRVESPQDLVFHGPGCVEHEGRFYLIPKKNVPKMKWLDYFWQKLRGKNKKKQYSWEGSIEQIPKNQTLELLAMREAGIEIEGSEELNKLFQVFDDIKNRKTPEKSTLPLKPFQKIGVQWMLDLSRLGLGGILADDMGLGKTIQSIGLLEGLRIKGEMGHCLVVVPTSLTFNWVSEMKKFAPEMPVFNFSGGQLDAHSRFLKENPHSVTVITYGLFARNCKNFENEARWNLALFDEAQNLKNIKATRTGYARKFPCKIKFCLTGTPMENHYGEFYSLIDLAVPGALGSYSEFMNTYNFKASKGVDFEKMSHHIEYLKMKTAPLVMRRTKENILKELPDKTETTLMLAFEEKQERIYRDIAIAYNEKINEVVNLKGDANSRLQVLLAILRLRQACSYPQALPDINYNETPPKIKALFGQLEQVAEEGHKALVFTNFRSTLEAIETGLHDRGLKCFTISGSTSKAKREKVLKEFESCKEAAVLGMTLKTGGVGLNLTCANYVFHIEPWWNPAAEAQATDRAHRMGQKQKVQVYRYIMKDSIEEKIELLKGRKNMAIDGLFSEDPEKIDKTSYAKSGLTYKDFQYLIS